MEKILRTSLELTLTVLYQYKRRMKNMQKLCFINMLLNSFIQECHIDCRNYQEIPQTIKREMVNSRQVPRTAKLTNSDSYRKSRLKVASYTFKINFQFCQLLS